MKQQYFEAVAFTSTVSINLVTQNKNRIIDIKTVI